MKARFVPNAVGLGLACDRRGPKRPSERRPSGVRPEEGAGDQKEAKANEWFGSVMAGGDDGDNGDGNDASDGDGSSGGEVGKG